VFCEKNYNAFFICFSFIVIIILNQLNIKKKIDRDNFGKNHKKITWKNTATIHSVLKKKITKQTLKRGKKSCWKHCSNSQCFVMKATVLPRMI
jgi:hypothetical protein